MLNYEQFLEPQRAMVIAPAGYGKTFTIAECIRHTTGRQLILTHTHAGIASIKAKLQSAGISNSAYSVETITSFAQKYVLAFCNDPIPEQSRTDEYYRFLISKASELFELGPVKRIISSSYDGLFVDEYQDCILSQHILVAALSQVLKTRILGDPLQGIFGFKEPLVDLEHPEHMYDFLDNRETLETPWRWQLENANSVLGENLKIIRRQLIASQPVDIRNYSGVEFHQVPEADLYDGRKDYHRLVSGILNVERNVLVIHPESKNIEPRIKFLQSFQNRLVLIESIDAKELYITSSKLDALDRNNPMPALIDILRELFMTSAINVWFGADRLRNKRTEGDIAAMAPVGLLIEKLRTDFSFGTIEEILKAVDKLPGVKCYRKNLLHSIGVALLNAEANGETVLASMQAHRNIVRRVGRSVEGKCLGTTLLTKGLEFETVVLINAHKFESREHLYVALTRASKRLVVFANNPIFEPYPQPAAPPLPTLFDGLEQQ